MDETLVKRLGERTGYFVLTNIDSQKKEKSNCDEPTEKKGPKIRRQDSKLRT